jgi:hypothetical protein
MHPNAIDANYSNHKVQSNGTRAAADLQIVKRATDAAIGLPREAIQQRPASHGTCVAGIVARCTEGFVGADGAPAVRILPASVRSEKAYAVVGFAVKSPISAFIKLVYCLNKQFPTGEFSPAPDDPIQNSGDVRVVSVSASIPRSYFSKAQWKLVSPVVGKACSAMFEDLRRNDRVYVFAAGNEAQSEPNRPCDEPYVIGVSATMPYDPSQPWIGPTPLLDEKGQPKWEQEGSNLGPKCVSAPGYGIITSTIYPCPNLAYLPPEEIPKPWPNYSTPPRSHSWEQQTNRFSATSSATPQVSALAALLYAQDAKRQYGDVIAAIEASTAGRKVTASYGESRGLVDYRAALGQW